jgi:excisionase family DNA binding protein
VKPPFEIEEMLTVGEVARLAGVDPKTVTRWARAGKLRAIRTPGGHRRYRRTDVDVLLKGPKVAPATRAEVETMLREGVDIDDLIAAIRGEY